jgi:hypothetical protein
VVHRSNLANRGVRAANVPLVPEVPPPAELESATRPLVVGLITDPERLVQIRVNRLRLLVKDPDWMFAYWDVDPRSLASLRADLGERASALSQLTLRVFEDRGGGASTFLVPQDARTWYVPTRSAGRAYRAEVGVILPSGEFRPLARSNSVVTPRGARSSQKAKRTVRYDRARTLGQVAALASSSEEAAAADEPWSPPLDAGAGPEEERPRAAPRSGGKPGERGGASDLHRR